MTNMCWRLLNKKLHSPVNIILIFLILPPRSTASYCLVQSSKTGFASVPQVLKLHQAYCHLCGFMVYCSKCGTQNRDDARNCTNCGAPLQTVGERYPGSEREHYRRVENGCFGLPNGGAIAALVFGAIIILVGVSLFLQANYDISFNFWPLIIVILGLLILAGGLYNRQRRQNPT